MQTIRSKIQSLNFAHRSSSPVKDTALPVRKRRFKSVTMLQVLTIKFMPRLNWKIILYNIAEAREELERIEAEAKKQKGKPCEIELETMLEHAYHHLNYAWNVRHVSTERYRNCAGDDFNEWSKFPKEIKAYNLKDDD